MVAPLFEAVPPPLYGGTERVVSVLTEGLVKNGHDVTLFASGDSQTSADLAAITRRAVRLNPEEGDFFNVTLLQLSEVYRRADEFDVIHNHVGLYGLPFASLSETPTVTTAHGRLDVATYQKFHRAFPKQPLVSISDSQREPIPDVNWVATVYNAIDLASFHFRETPGDYLVFLGRMHPEKRPDRAIDIARDLGMRLIMAAKIDPVDRDYFKFAIEPLIRSSSLIEFIGEVDEPQKDELLGGAYAYLFPIDWPEPFGLTMVESMATGTPVVAYRAGSVPEILKDGVTGFICDTVSDMAQAVTRVGAIDRRACREHAERYFAPSVMVRGYEQVYEKLVRGNNPHRIVVETTKLPVPA
jgi:glycosyltransferase involved in cell wall biosynthesis